MEILTPKLQLSLFEYDNFFNSFIKLYRENKLPNVMLFSGPKGLGKSTFAYHFINFVLSEYEDKSYDVVNYSINPLNKTLSLSGPR